MFNTLIDCIKGVYTVKARGRFAERILNIAAVSGIYIHKVRREDEETILFCLSKKGYGKLTDIVPEGIELQLVTSYGFPIFFRKHRKRILLFLLPLFFIITTSLLSLFIWNVEIEGADSSLQKQVSKFISDNGVYVGAIKHKIDPYDVKRTAILEIDDLSWIWVDIRGTTAKVKIRKRTPKPDIISVNEPSDVIAMHSGIVEKMQVFCGIPLVKEGDYVKKGQILATGVFRSENENIPTYYHHATANVIVRLSEEKSVLIPKKTAIKTPTGEKKNTFSINFKKNRINFSLNSGISYKEYDKIEKKYALPLIPIYFSKTVFEEIRVDYIDTDIAEEIKLQRKVFLDELERKNMELIELTENCEEKDNSVTVTFSAECRVRTDKEIPIDNTEGVADGKNS